MGALLESGLVGNIGLKHLKVIKEDTINKWDKLGWYPLRTLWFTKRW